ncbi:MAG: glycoside hydrolase family 125 protein [Bacillota bacterium]|nr:glycoside hydrolase family 125 protein [Bacillota bacterium]
MKVSLERESNPIPEAMKAHVESYAGKLAAYPRLQEQYRRCFVGTWKTALQKQDDGTVFVLTGDIPAMWLRDSSAQVNHYIDLCVDSAEIAAVMEGILRRQFMYIRIDPYANAFNVADNDQGYVNDIPRKNPWVWEQKYEVDSLCYPIRLLYLYWKKTGKTELIEGHLEELVQIITNQWRTEQHHMEKSPYRFTRPDYQNPWDTLHNEGMGNPVVYTGMTWSGFRPSDDACQYGYLTASQMFAVVVLGYMEEMLLEICDNPGLAKSCAELRAEIDAGIQKFSIVEDDTFGPIYCCETDGMGNYMMIDDANIPSLLSAPYIGYLDAHDEIYQNTRKFLLSGKNPYYFVGKYAKGIGSRHSPDNYVWHMALAMQGLTSIDREEKAELLQTISATDGGTYHMHESFDVDNPENYTREWFT